jgi:hypothetical protein
MKKRYGNFADAAGNNYGSLRNLTNSLSNRYKNG